MDLQTDDFLNGGDADTMLAVVANLFIEVSTLSERVTALEATDSAHQIGGSQQDRSDAIAHRVLSPLTADPEVP